MRITKRMEQPTILSCRYCPRCPFCKLI